MHGRKQSRAAAKIDHIAEVKGEETEDAQLSMYQPDRNLRELQHIFVNNEGKNTIQVIDVKTWKATASWPLAPCEGPTGIAYDKATNRIFSGCNKTSVVVDASTGQIVASIKNGTLVDALGWDPSKKLIFIPNGGEGNVTVVHQDSADKYTEVATVATFVGAKTICVDPKTHNAYLFQPERGPAPAPPAGAEPPAKGGRGGRGPQGPIVAAWFIVIKQEWLRPVTTWSSDVRL
jgi:hypothetical protein